VHLANNNTRNTQKITSSSALSVPSTSALLYRDLVEAGIDLFEDIIQNMFQLADTQGKGYVSKEEFTQVQCAS